MIAISNIRYVQTGCKVALFDVDLPNIDFIIRNMAKLESKGRSWVSYPTAFEETGGEKKFFPYCQFKGDDKSKAFLKTVETELEKILGEQKEVSPPVTNEVPF